MFRHALKRYALPWATRFFAAPPLRGVPLLLEMGGAALQSKRGGGYAATWQEIRGALNFIEDPHPVVLDVGANVGNWTGALLDAMPGARKVVMFEPQPSCWQVLQALCGDKVALDKRAVSAKPGTLPFWVNANSEMSSLHERTTESTGSRQISVEVTTIDDVIAATGIGTVDYMKIDVEGHELSVINGARDAIAGGKIKAFSFEFGQADVASRTFFCDFWECIRGLGLEIYRLGHDGFAIHVQNYSYDLESFAGVANYVASTHRPRWLH